MVDLFVLITHRASFSKLSIQVTRLVSMFYCGCRPTPLLACGFATQASSVPNLCDCMGCCGCLQWLSLACSVLLKCQALFLWLHFTCHNYLHVLWWWLCCASVVPWWVVLPCQDLLSPICSSDIWSVFQWCLVHAWYYHGKHKQVHTPIG